MTPFTERLTRSYDGLVDLDFFGELYDESGFMNYGYWHEDIGSQREASQNLVEELLAFIPEKSGTMLDVACGKGATTRHLLRYYRTADLTGINISERQLQVCRETVPGVTFHRMDATAMDFAEASFDNVICVEAAMHFDTRAQFLREAHRVLAPGGRLVLSDIVFPPSSPLQPLANSVESAEAYRQECLRAGFADVTVVDATEPCWGGFARNATRDALVKLRTGEIGLRRFYRTLGVLRSLYTEMYLLACCVKA